MKNHPSSISRMFFVVFLIAMNVGFANAQNPQLTFDDASRALQNGELSDAKSKFHQILSSEQYSGPLFVNLGLIAIQEDSLGLAKYYFTSAARFPETLSESEEGIRYVENRLRYKTPVLPKLPWDKAVDFLSDNLGPNKIAIIGILILNLAAIVLVLMWLGRIPMFMSTFGFVSTTIVGILIILLAFYVENVEKRYDHAIQITEKAILRDAPNEEGTLVSNTYEGYAFTIDRKKSADSAWFHVRLSNGTYGWIQPEHLNIIPL